MTRNAPILIEVSPELAAFILENCESNLGMGIQILSNLTSRDLQEKMVATIENFRALQAATKAALKEVS